MIGRQVRITSMGFRNPASLPTILSHVEMEARNACDLILLPEACLGDDVIVSLDGPEVYQVAQLAALYHTYIVFPVFRSDGATGRVNSAILIDRTGKIAGVFNKVFPFWSEFDLVPPVTPGDDAPVFVTDFGKVGLAICFDINFPEVFERLSILGAQLVLWPSAYSAGMSIQAHAINYNYIIITSTMTPDCSVYDITGQESYYQKSDGWINVSHLTIDLDRCVFHEDFNLDKRDRLLREHKSEIESDVWLDREKWFTLRATVPGISAKALAAEYHMEELGNYKSRSRREIDRIRRYRFADKEV